MASVIEKGAAVVGAVVAVIGFMAGPVIYVARIEPAMSTNSNGIARMESRVDRIEEARTINLQRLSKVEEAVQSTKDTLATINAKLDRALMRR